MKASFISSEFYFSLKSPLQRMLAGSRGKDFTEYYRKFLDSGYERILLTLEMYQSLQSQKSLLAPQLCLYFRDFEVGNNLKLIQKLKTAGARILLGSSSAACLAAISTPDLFDEMIFWLEKSPAPTDFKILKAVPRLHLLFSYRMSGIEIQSVLKKMKEEAVSWNVSNYIELAAQKNLDFWYSPQEEMLFKRAANKKIQNSVIIPFQDNVEELSLTLKFLSQSVGAGESIELILVDDSFSRGHIPWVISLLEGLPLPVTYLKLERPQDRQRGDLSFRAGVARNRGAQKAIGQELIFIDSDILLGRDFWESLRQVREKSSGPAMPRRYFLKKGLDLNSTSFADIQVGTHSQLSWGGHWEDFYRNFEGEKNVWRWTSTFCLALPRNTFLALGGFRRGFYCYGFEDTDLGYRLHQQDHELRLLNCQVFHLPVQEGRSEYAGKMKLRKTLMTNSFKVFQRSALSDDLKSHFQHMID